MSGAAKESEDLFYKFAAYACNSRYSAKLLPFFSEFTEWLVREIGVADVPGSSFIRSTSLRRRRNWMRRGEAGEVEEGTVSRSQINSLRRRRRSFRMDVHA